MAPSRSERAPVIRWLRHARAGDAALWEWQVRRIERRCARTPPPRRPIVLTGSSSIWLWRTMAQDLAPLPVLNHGFGGSHMAHVTHFLDRLVVPFAPHTLVVYSGDNDIAGTLGPKRTPEEVRDAAEALLDHVSTRLPETRVILLSIKPSRARWLLWPEMRRANELLARCCQARSVTFLDVATPLLAQPPEPPDRSLFRWDGLHLSRRGYAAWAGVLRPALVDAAGPDAERLPPAR